MSRSLRIKPVGQVKGQLLLPGDKSISHRVAMLASIASGESRIKGFATSADCRSTLECLRRLGVEVTENEKEIVIQGRGLRGYKSPGETVLLDAGNSGTTIRLLSGILAGQELVSEISGDESLRSRPMRRILEPLSMMGATIEARAGNYPPLKIKGSRLKAINYVSPVASAQVKSCVLLAGLLSEGETTVVEPAASRNHTEIMLAEFGVRVGLNLQANAVTVEGGGKLVPVDYNVPGDLSSAAFFIAAATILSESRVMLRNVCLNPTRTAFLEVLAQLGASIERHNVAERHGEVVGDLQVTSCQLKTQAEGLILSGAIIPNIIDEIPILAVAATQTEGRIEVRDARELRIKESDRISAIVSAIRSLGGEIEEFEDGFAISGPQRLHGGQIETRGDHRIAMSMAIAGLVATGRTELIGADSASVSFPEFYQSIQMLTQGAAVE